MLNIFVLFYLIVHLISSFLLTRYTRSLLVPCAYVSIESIDCVLLTSFLFMMHLFVPFIFYLYHCCLLNSYMFLILTQQIIS